MTRTMTSKACGSGTSISSTWKASLGSPSRSWRMTQAAMVSGSSPGSVSTWETWVKSTATCSFLARSGARDITCPPSEQPGAPEDHEHEQQGHERAADAVDQERRQRVDVVDHPAEVLAEEADDEGQRQEDRRQHGQARDDLVQAVGAGRRVEAERVADAVAQPADD